MTIHKIPDTPQGEMPKFQRKTILEDVKDFIDKDCVGIAVIESKENPKFYYPGEFIVSSTISEEHLQGYVEGMLAGANLYYNEVYWGDRGPPKREKRSGRTEIWYQIISITTFDLKMVP